MHGAPDDRGFLTGSRSGRMMVNCSDFLRDYSDYRDDLLRAEVRAGYDRHLLECEACARYDRVVGGGVATLRDAPEVEPASDFLPRLQHRISNLEEREAFRSNLRSSARPLAVVGVALGLIGSAVYLVDGESDPAMIELPPAIAAAPKKEYPVGTLFREGPLLEPAAPASSRSSSSSVFFRYTPLGSYARYETPAAPR